MKYPDRIDLHMHTRVSDGTDSPEEILSRVKEAGIDLFSVTDHDAVKGCQIIQNIRTKDDPKFIPGVEFSCKDELGKYHILGYAYDVTRPPIMDVVDLGHSYRMEKLKGRLDFLKEKFGFTFPEEEIKKLFSLDNPGKPHIGNLMAKFGYAASKDVAIREFLNKAKFPTKYVRPEEAIAGILGSGGVPVLAHPSYGSGDQIIVGDEMEERIRRLMGFGLQGLEAYYSGFTKRLIAQNLGFAEKYDLYVTAGSDYHGSNKLVILGDTNLASVEEAHLGLKRFLDRVIG